jgi:hypothetical protein
MCSFSLVVLVKVDGVSGVFENLAQDVEFGLLGLLDGLLGGVGGSADGQLCGEVYWVSGCVGPSGVVAHVDGGWFVWLGPARSLAT